MGMDISVFDKIYPLFMMGYEAVRIVSDDATLRRKVLSYKGTLSHTTPLRNDALFSTLEKRRPDAALLDNPISKSMLRVLALGDRVSLAKNKQAAFDEALSLVAFVGAGDTSSTKVLGLELLSDCSNSIGHFCKALSSEEMREIIYSPSVQKHSVGLIVPDNMSFFGLLELGNFARDVQAAEKSGMKTSVRNNSLPSAAAKNKAETLES